MFRSFGLPEIAIILVIILIFFGVGKLPQVGSAIGKGLRAFKQGQQGVEDEEVIEEAPEPAPKKKTAAKKTTAKKTTVRKTTAKKTTRKKSA